MVGVGASGEPLRGRGTGALLRGRTGGGEGDAAIPPLKENQVEFNAGEEEFYKFFTLSVCLFDLG